jgi:hypothetical protein
VVLFIFASFYPLNCLRIFPIIVLSTCMTYFIHLRQLSLPIKFLPLHFLILNNFFSCLLHFYLNINHHPPMLCRLLSPFLGSIVAPQLHHVASVEMCGSTCDFFLQVVKLVVIFLFVISFFYHEVFSSLLLSAFALCSFSTFEFGI